MPEANFPHPEERPAGARLAARTPPVQVVEPTPAAALAGARRLVIKIGSALLVDDGGEIRRAWLDALADDVARCRARQQELILVSSGAIAVGRRHLRRRDTSRWSARSGLRSTRWPAMRRPATARAAW